MMQVLIERVYAKKDEKGVSVRALGGVPLSFQHPPVSLGRHASVFIAI